MDLKRNYIDIAYENFAEYGPGKFTFESIAAETGIPPFSLRKNYKNINNLVDSILERHFIDVEECLLECRKNCKNYPDIHGILMKFNKGVIFQKQLYLNRDTPLYDFVFIHVNHLSKDILVLKFIDYYDLNIPLLTAEITWLEFVNVWYSKLDINNMSEEMMQQATDDIMNIMLKFKYSSN